MVNFREIKSEWQGYVFAALMVFAATFLFIQGRQYFARGQWALLYLLIVVLVASRSGVRPAVLAAVVAFFSWNFFFLPPYHTFHIYDPKDWLSLFVFLIVGIIMGMQTGRLKEREALARMRGQETASLNTFSAHLVSDISIDELADVLASEVAVIMNTSSIVLFTASSKHALTRVVTPDALSVADDHMTRLAEWSYSQSKAIGLPRAGDLHHVMPDGWPVSVPHAEAGVGNPKQDMVIPLQTATRQVGILYAGERLDGTAHTIYEARFLIAIANQAAAFLERKQLQSIAVQADALREADRMKSNLVSSVSHELKTPLASSTATLTNLLENDLTWDESLVREDIRAVLNDLERLNDSISSLVDLSRLESADWEPNRDWYELGEILGTVLSRISQKRRRRIVFALPHDEIPPINVDYAQWVRVLSNLIENALDYADEDTKVHVGASAGAGDIRIWVEDQGPGIPEEEKARIFDKFFRGSASAKVPSGTGLGLAIAKEIVLSHGGKIWVEDVQPQGARFVLSLPNSEQEDMKK
ncbi:MAG: DUF4118 domain-containing protein [Armatimonadota bacterium]